MKTIVKLVLFSVLFSCSREQKSPNKISNLSIKKTVSICKSKETKSNSSQNKINEIDNYGKDFVYFKKLMKKYEEPSQFFTVSGSGSQIINGKKGTVLYVDPNDFETLDGKEVTDSIKVELKELLTTNELLRSGAQTVSNGELLISGGSYYIDATSNGKKLKLKSGRILKAEFPKTSNDNMLVYYGSFKNNLMDWKTSNQQFPQRPYLEEKRIDTTGNALFSRIDKKFVNLSKAGRVYIATDTVEMSEVEYKEYQDQIKEENQLIKEQNKLASKLYGPVNLTNSGWVNCDRPNPYLGNDIFISVNGSEGVKSATAFIVFKGMNSLVQSYSFSSKNRMFYFRNLPPNAEVTLIAYTIINGKILSCKENLFLNKKSGINIILNETSESDFKKMLVVK